MTIILTLVILLLLVAGCAILQIFLSRRESRWPGLILPGLNLLLTLLMVFSLVLFSYHSTTTEFTDENGTAVLVSDQQEEAANSNAVAAGAVTILLLYNIPTVLLLVIYFICRGKPNRTRSLTRMQVQDLD